MKHSCWGRHDILLLILYSPSFWEKQSVLKMTQCTPALSESPIGIDFILFWHSDRFSFQLGYVQYVLLVWVSFLETCQPHHTSTVSVSRCASLKSSYLPCPVSLGFSFSLLSVIQQPGMMFDDIMSNSCKVTPCALKAHWHHSMRDGSLSSEALKQLYKLFWQIWSFLFTLRVDF